MPTYSTSPIYFLSLVPFEDPKPSLVDHLSLRKITPFLIPSLSTPTFSFQNKTGAIRPLEKTFLWFISITLLSPVAKLISMPFFSPDPYLKPTSTVHPL